MPFSLFTGVGIFTSLNVHLRCLFSSWVIFFLVCGSFADYTYVLRIIYFFAMCVFRKTNCFPQTVILPLDFTVFFFTPRVVK